MSMETKTPDRINPFSDLTGFQRDLMVTIDSFDEKPSGQQILDKVQNNGYEEASHGRLYPNLDVLKNKGLIEKGELDRRTNYYIPSQEGQIALSDYEDFVGGGN